VCGRQPARAAAGTAPGGAFVCRFRRVADATARCVLWFRSALATGSDDVRDCGAGRGVPRRRPRNRQITTAFVRAPRQRIGNPSSGRALIRPAASGQSVRSAGRLAIRDAAFTRRPARNVAFT
jgi:hypothetical protein